MSDDYMILQHNSDGEDRQNSLFTVQHMQSGCQSSEADDSGQDMRRGTPTVLLFEIQHQTENLDNRLTRFLPETASHGSSY